MGWIHLQVWGDLHSKRFGVSCEVALHACLCAGPGAETGTLFLALCSPLRYLILSDVGCLLGLKSKGTGVLMRNKVKPRMCPDSGMRTGLGGLGECNSQLLAITALPVPPPTPPPRSSLPYMRS